MIRHSNRSDAQRLIDTQGERGWLAIVESYGETFRHGGMVVTCAPAAVEALLMERAHVEKRARAHRVLGRLPGAAGMLWMDGEPWRTRARAVAPTFNRHKVHGAAYIVHQMATDHADRWAAAGRVSDLYLAVQQLGVDTVMKIGFGFDPRDPLTVKLAAALVTYKNRSMDPRPGLRLDTFGTGASTMLRLPRIAYRLWRDHARVRRAFRAVLERGRRTAGTNWVSGLQEARLSEQELASEVNHLYGAFNAIDYVVTRGLCELARRPDLVHAIRSELENALGARELPTAPDLDRMPTMKGFILELFRRFPVSMGIVRELGEPITLAGETLQTGTQMLVLLHALHHHPDFWDDPWTIKPERWTSGTPRVPFSYVPFLFGGRKCLGRDMAEQHMLLVLSAIVRRFDIAVFAEPVVPPYMIPRFAHPLPFSLTPA